MKTLLSILTICAGLMATSASAATISGWIAENQTVDADDKLESGFGAYAGSQIDHVVVNDFSGPLGSPVLDIDDDSWIFGRVWDNYSDSFRVDLTGFSYVLQITALVYDKVDSAETLKFGIEAWDRHGTEIVDIKNNYGDYSTWTSGTLTGASDIRLSAFSRPGRRNGSNVRYLVDVVEVAAVPLPATSILLLAGLGGLGAMSRRKKS